MSTTSTQLVGCVIRLAKRELDVWKASPAVEAAAGAGGSANSTSAEVIAEAETALASEIQKLRNSGLPKAVQEHQTAEALLAGVKVLFKGLCDPGTLSSVSLSSLAGSATLRALHSLRKVFGLPGDRLKEVPTAAVVSALAAIRGSDKGGARKMFTLVEYFVEEVCEKAWGIDDAWGDREAQGRRHSPLNVVTEGGGSVYALAVLQKAKTADVSRAVAHAHVAGHSDVFDLLIEDERCLDTGEMPLILRLIAGLSQLEASAEIKAARRLMTEHLLRRWPQVAKDRWLSEEIWEGPLSQAVAHREVQLTKVILEVAPESLCFEEKREIFDGKLEVTNSTLVHALVSPCAEIMRMLIDAGVLSVEKYAPSVVEGLSCRRAVFLAGAFPLKPGSEAGYTHLIGYRDEIREVMDLLLAARFPSFSSSDNVTLTTLFANMSCIMEEEHAISYLLKCKEAGLDIIHARKEEVGKHDAYTLVHIAASVGYSKLLDLAIQMQGPESVNAWHEGRTAAGAAVKHTPLTMALGCRQVDIALRLLRHHKAKAVYRYDVPPDLRQPLCYALGLEDNAALIVVRELIKQDPSLCDLDHYRQLSTVSENPITKCCTDNMLRCLEALLSANLPGVHELCKLEHNVKGLIDGAPCRFVVISAQVAAGKAYWDVLSLLLRYCPQTSVISRGKQFLADGRLFGEFPSVEEFVKGKLAPRSILLQVEAMARRQRAEEKKRKKVAAVDPALPSNAFEDPGPKVLTEAEERRKAQKKAAKKKAKAKKKAAAAVKEGNAGAGKEAGAADSDSDSSGTDGEEAGMDEEEKMMHRAPTFDLEKEKVARRARAEAEAKAKKSDKEECT
jgi:hypothetical protein